MGKAIVLDTSALIMGYEAAEVEAEHYTVPSVREEIQRDDIRKLRLDSAINSGRITVKSPDTKYRDEAQRIIGEMGEADALSEADAELLALGAQLKGEGWETTVVSDDYSVQNVASELGLGFKGLATQGIKRQFKWETYCPGCRRTFEKPQEDGVCPICGTDLKRRPSRKRPLRT
jgi:UPF0271 protein